MLKIRCSHGRFVLFGFLYYRLVTCFLLAKFDEAMKLLIRAFVFYAIYFYSSCVQAEVKEIFRVTAITQLYSSTPTEACTNAVSEYNSANGGTQLCYVNNTDNICNLGHALDSCVPKSGFTIGNKLFECVDGTFDFNTQQCAPFPPPEPQTDGDGCYTPYTFDPASKACTAPPQTCGETENICVQPPLECGNVEAPDGICPDAPLDNPPTFPETNCGFFNGKYVCVSTPPPPIVEPPVDTPINCNETPDIPECSGATGGGTEGTESGTGTSTGTGTDTGTGTGTGVEVKGTCDPEEPGYTECISPEAEEMGTHRTARSIDEVHTEFSNKINNSAIVQSFSNVKNLIPSGSGNCPALSIELPAPFSRNIGTNIHCNLFEDFRPFFTSIMLGFFLIIGFKIAASA